MNRVGGALAEDGAASVTGLEGSRNSSAATRQLLATQKKADMQSSSNKALQACTRRARDMAAEMGLASAVADAASNLLTALDKLGELKRKSGASGEAMCAAMVYFACRTEVHV